MANKDERTLYNLLTRHQVYLEGVKLGLSFEFRPYLRELDDEIRKLFARLEYGNLGEMTKRELQKFLKRVRKSQRSIYNRYNTQLSERTLEFMRVDVDVTRDLYIDIEGITPEEAYEEDRGEPVAGIAALSGNKKGDSLLWAKIANDPIPANGMKVDPFVAAFILDSMSRVENAVIKGWSNKYTVFETLRLIRGTKGRNYRDGELNKINNNNSAVVKTVLQHIDSEIQAGIASLFYPRYQWVSVLDGRTTEICLSRSNKIYEFGRGPLPPAHIGCRSKIVPTNKSEAEYKQTYYAWIRQQPVAVQDDILGRKRGLALRKGELTAKDFPKFNEINPISIEQFGNKRTLIKE
jgi:hypothetical protein